LRWSLLNFFLSSGWPWIIFLIFILFICASPPSLPLSPHYQAETILPLSLILLNREYKQ
jgi:hypothetical protein